MVLWEITLTTAYFLGLKRTYKLALRIQRRLIGSNHPKIRQFVHRRTRSIFDVAVRFHQNIQQKDLELGRSVGSWLLRWLDHMKPSAEIRPHPEKLCSRVNSTPKQTTNSGLQSITKRLIDNKDSEGKLFFSALNRRPRSYPTIAMMMQPMRPASMNSQSRHFSHYTTGGSGSESGVFRKDIALWMRN